MTNILCRVIPFANVTVILGQPDVCNNTYFDSRKNTRRVTKVIAHPDYEVKSHSSLPKKGQPVYDVALLKVVSNE